MREPFTGTLPCPLGREGAQTTFAVGWLASRPLAPWEVRPAVFQQMVIAGVIGNPGSGQTPGAPVRRQAWVRPPVEDRFDPSCTLPNGRKCADAITLEALNTENAYNSRTKAK